MAYPELKDVKIISARNAYEKAFPGDSHEWKLRSFLEMVNDLDRNAITNIVAIGDSNIEMNAAQHLANKFPSSLIKTIKFRTAPRPLELVKQINLVSKKMQSIATAARNLTIRLEKKSNVISSKHKVIREIKSIDGPSPPADFFKNSTK